MFKEGVSLFGLADASQLKIANAFMSDYFWVVHGEHNEDLLLLGQAALDMNMFPRAKPFPSNMLDVSLANSKIIKDRSGRHTLPASFLGVRMSKLKHRVANLLHLERLLQPPVPASAATPFCGCSCYRMPTQVFCKSNPWKSFAAVW